MTPCSTTRTYTSRTKEEMRISSLLFSSLLFSSLLFSSLLSLMSDPTSSPPPVVVRMIRLQTLPGRPPIRFPVAPQPDVVRAVQKDDWYIQAIRKEIQDIAGRPRVSVRLRRELNLMSDALYYGLTTLWGLQTLGEEYCDLLQVYRGEGTLVTLVRRCLLSVLHIGLPYARERATDIITWWIQSNSALLRWMIPRIESMVDVVQRIHLALFYMTGTFYHVAKRLTNVGLVYCRKPSGGRPRYNILGALIFLQLGISAFLWLRQNTISRQRLCVDGVDVDMDPSSLSPPALPARDESDPSFGTSGKCVLCLGHRKDPTATVCGHVFCWSCIAESCSRKAECPLCRHPTPVSSLLRMYNYH